MLSRGRPRGASAPSCAGSAPAAAPASRTRRAPARDTPRRCSRGRTRSSAARSPGAGTRRRPCCPRSTTRPAVVVADRDLERGRGLARDVHRLTGHVTRSSPTSNRSAWGHGLSRGGSDSTGSWGSKYVYEAAARRIALGMIGDVAQRRRQRLPQLPPHRAVAHQRGRGPPLWTGGTRLALRSSGRTRSPRCRRCGRRGRG